MKKNKFYEFKNEADSSYGLYIYGALTDDKETDWCASSQDIDLTDFKDALSKLKSNTTLNMYVNSPGGSVFASSTMASMLQRMKETKNVKIVTYIDGLCASATSFLIMVSDEIKLYTNSMLMVHKPMSMAFGNANDMQKEIDTLNSIEENVMMPLYMKKAKVDEETIRNLIEVESWLSAKEVDNFFNVDLIDSAKECTACIDSKLFKKYKNVPEELKKEEEEVEEEEKEIIIPETEEENPEEPHESEETAPEEVEKPQKEEKPTEDEPVEEQETEEETEKEPVEEEKVEEEPIEPEKEEESSEEPETSEKEEESEDDEEPKQQKVVEKPQNIDYSYFENRLNSLRGDR